MDRIGRKSRHTGSERRGSGATRTHRFRTDRTGGNQDSPFQNGADREKQGHNVSERTASGETRTHRFRTDRIGGNQDTLVQNGPDPWKPGHTGSERTGSEETRTHRFRTGRIGQQSKRQTIQARATRQSKREQPDDNAFLSSSMPAGFFLYLNNTSYEQ